MNYSNQTQQQEEVELLDEVVLENKLVLHNDNVNTFDWVIETLVEVCKHTIEQAEQCSYLIHSKGKYAVKRGAFDVLKPMKDAITDRGINATIE